MRERKTETLDNMGGGRVGERKAEIHMGGGRDSW